MFQEDASSSETKLLEAEDVAVSMLALDLILVFSVHSKDSFDITGKRERLAMSVCF